MNFEFLKVERLENGATLVTIQRPEALNALNSTLLRELGECYQELTKDPSHRVVLLTGTGKAFVAGADISLMKEYDSRAAEEFSDLGQSVFALIDSSSIVSIALINGFALGGGLELALACDIRIASVQAKIGLPEVSLGLIPGFGGTQRLGRLVGYGKSLEVVLSGDMYTAEAGFQMGIINHVVAPEELRNKGESLAKSILSRGKHAIREAKRVLKQGCDQTIPLGMLTEKKAFAALFDGPESKEGMGAFLEKRKPNF